jgi:hypothetical protein
MTLNIMNIQNIIHNSIEWAEMFWMFMMFNVIVLVVPTRCWLVFFSVIQFALLRRPV